MKIEKKYRVPTEGYDIVEVNCLIDDDGKVVAAADLGDNDFYAAEKNELFFDTEDAARQSLAAVLPTDEEIKRVLRFLKNAPDEKIKEYDETIKTVTGDKSYLYMAIYGKMYEYVYDNCTDFLSNSFVRRIKCLVRQQILNIDGVSVPIDNVSHVKWGDGSQVCKLVLKDGTEVFCSEKDENDLWFVKLVFGGNDSSRHFPNLRR